MSDYQQAKSRSRGNRGAASSAAAEAAKPQARGGAGGRQVQPQQPDPKSIVQGLAPVLEAYGYNEAEVHALVKRCNYDQGAIQAAVSHILEEREGHEHGEWSTTATASEKKEKAAMAKERQAQKEKEMEEERELEKQRRKDREEEEKRKYIEIAARRKAFEEEKRKPGSALVQRAAPWSSGGPGNDATGKEAVAENGYAQGADQVTPEADTVAQDDYPAQEEAPAEETQEWVQPSYDAVETADASAEQPPMYAAPSTNDYVLPAPPGVPLLPEQASGWSAQGMAGWDGSGLSAAPYGWSSDSAGAGWNDPASAVVSQPPANGKSQWVSEPVITALVDDTVIMPSSFWDLVGSGPIPQVKFGSLHVHTTSVQPEGDASGSYDDVQDAAGDEKGQQDDGQAPRRDRGPRKEGSGKKGGKKGGGYRGREEKGEKGDAGAEGAADDGKGKASKKGSTRGSAGDRGGPGGSSGKGKGWRSEKGEKGEKGERGKAGGKYSQ